MRWLKQTWFYFIRTVLIALFFSFYLILIAVNVDRIEESFEPLKYFKSAPLQVTKRVFVGSYPNAKELQSLQKMGIKRVICLLDPRFPVTRELVAYEKQNCHRMGIEFISLPQRDFARYSDMIPVVTEILDENSKTTYINSYFVTKRVKQLSAALASDAEQTP